LALRLGVGFVGVLVCFGMLFANVALGQNAGITIGKTELGVGQTFSITISAKDDFTSPPMFPDIKGMPKQGSSSGSSTMIVNGVVSSTYSTTQRYLAAKEGRYTLTKFSTVINGTTYAHPGATIIVKKGVADDVDPSTVYDPYEEFFGNRRATSYRSVKENAFLGVDADKSSVWVGEGLTLTLSLYVADDNKADIDFFDLNSQVGEITKRIRPKNCWEENFNIINIEPRQVRLNGKAYTEYRIWQAAFYPLDAKPIVIPRVGLKMIKYEMSADPFLGLERNQTFTTLYSKPIRIGVKEVPPNSYGRVLPVGEFMLQEGIGKATVETGQSVTYQFVVKGEGNLAGVDFAAPQPTPALDIYPPTVQQRILREFGRVTGQKMFTFLLQPKREGKYPLREQGFVFPFFNPKTGQYDSLTSRITLTSVGAAPKPQEEPTEREENYLANNLIYLDNAEGLKVVGNIVLLLLATAMGVGMVWRGRKR
jgi:BatD DUF11 like domain